MTPELLLPAGSLEKMRTAYDFGADAVYAGLPRYSLRARNNDFRVEQLAQGIEEAHTRGKQFYVTANILPHNDKVRSFVRQLQPIVEMKPDAFIMADPGLIMLAREAWPDINIHLSVQANTLNYASVKFWQSVGVKRIILSRELSLDEIAEIRQQCPDMEIEVFVHGALCIAYSGRCLLSGYFNRRDPNQGTCTNACRWNYKMHDADQNEAGDIVKLQGFDFGKELEEANSSFSACGGTERHPAADQVYLIEEANRAGELMPIMEDEHGTYIMNSKDLRAIEYIEKLTNIGVTSLKIEGRTKSQYYVARTAQTYRRAIDDAVAGRPFNPELLLELEGLSNRGYTAGFLQRHVSQDTQNYITGNSEAKRSQFVGQVLSVEDGWALVDVKNRFALQDRLEVIHPQGNVEMILTEMRGKHNEAVDVAAGSGILVKIPLASTFNGAMIARLL
jgi:putative protease